jgi:hypothetical protein
MTRYIVWSVDPLTLEIFADTVLATDEYDVQDRVRQMRPDVVIPPTVPPMRLSLYMDNLRKGLGRTHSFTLLPTGYLTARDYLDEQGYGADECA